MVRRGEVWDQVGSGGGERKVARQNPVNPKPKNCGVGILPAGWG